MTGEQARLMDEALRLSPRDRAELAVRLLDSLPDELHTDDESSVSEEVGAVLLERPQQLESGEVEAIPDDELRSRLRKLVDALPPET